MHLGYCSQRELAVPRCGGVKRLRMFREFQVVGTLRMQDGRRANWYRPRVRRVFCKQCRCWLGGRANGQSKVKTERGRKIMRSG